MAKVVNDLITHKSYAPDNLFIQIPITETVHVEIVLSKNVEKLNRLTVYENDYNITEKLFDKKIYEQIKPTGLNLIKLLDIVWRYVNVV